MEGFPLPGPSSLWVETALPAEPCGAPSSDVEADICIVGAGYTGLHAALRAIERGLKPVVLEANSVGWGASGRNGGVVSAKYRVSIPDIAKAYGLETARRMVSLGHEAVDAVEAAIDRHRIQGAGLVMTGNVRCAHNAAALGGLVSEVSFMREKMGDSRTEVLSSEEVADETGSVGFVGGTLTRHSGAVHPLNYARGLAKAVRSGGGEIFENAPAIRLRRERTGFVIETTASFVRTASIVIATNAYSDLTPFTSRVARTLIPFRSAMIATAPLPAGIQDSVMKGKRTYSETRRMMRWFRPFEKRMIFGGRGAFGRADSESAFRALKRAMVKLYPQLEDVEVTHQWSGLVGLTLASVPHVGKLEQGITYAMGYNGTGVAMASLMGRNVVDIALGENKDLGIMGRTSLPSVPLYHLREPVVRAAAGWYQFLDAIGR